MVLAFRLWFGGRQAILTDHTRSKFGGPLFRMSNFPRNQLNYVCVTGFHAWVFSSVVVLTHFGTTIAAAPAA
jgi:hypothetical protein